MPTWGELLTELGALQAQAAKSTVPGVPGGPSPFDQLRRKYLAALHDKTKRAVIVYATGWLENVDVPNTGALSVTLSDVQAFMEAVSNINERELDLILTSPGGSAEAADAVMGYLRTRFDHIRCFVPVAAMSAATMMALSCDEIVMADHSQLGPIDPQFTILTPEGPRAAPGQAILDQFEMAKLECRDPSNIGAWLPLLRALLPGLLAQCRSQRELAEEFVWQNLARYMLAHKGASAEQEAKRVAGWFADHGRFKSHGRRVSRQDAQDLGLDVTPLEADDDLQDLVLSVHHAVRHTFAGTGTSKLVENHHGRAHIEMVQRVIVQGPMSPTAQPLVPVPGMPPGGGGAVAPRAERRQQERATRKRK